MLADMRERGLTNLGFSGASRWSASESFLGGYLFDRNYGNFSTGVDKFAMDTLEVRPLAKGLGWFVTWRVEFSALAWGCHLTLTPLIDGQSVRALCPQWA